MGAWRVVSDKLQNINFNLRILICLWARSCNQIGQMVETPDYRGKLSVSFAAETDVYRSQSKLLILLDVQA